MPARSRPRGPERQPLPTQARPTCTRCYRPQEHCYCHLIPSLPSRTEVVFLQHPRESDVPIGTARMAHLALPRSRLVVGVHLDDHPALQGLWEQPAGDVAVLFPGPDAIPLEQWHTPPKTLIVLDGTWSTAKKLLTQNPRVAALPRLSFFPDKPGNYRIRREPTEQHLATIEATAAVLGRLEGDPARFDAMLVPFTWMVDRQIEAGARSDEGEGRGRKTRPKATSRPGRLPELLPLLADPRRAVLLYAEAQGRALHDRSGDGLPAGNPQLLHLVALRPHTGDVLDVVLRPRRPLADSAPFHLELPPPLFDDGIDAAVALAQFRAFFGAIDGDDGLRASTLCLWGRFARDLLHDEGEPMHGFIDLRALAARLLQRSPGGIENGARGLGVSDSDDDGAGDNAALAAVRGRAGRRLRTLARIHALLLSRCVASTTEPQPSHVLPSDRA